MQFLAMLMPLLGLVAFAGFVWLVVVAFKNSPMWGVLVLLLSPITAIIFAVKNWEESKKAFLVYFGAGAAWSAIFLMFVVFIGGSMVQMAAQMADGAMTEEGAAQVMELQIEPMEDSGLSSEVQEAEEPETEPVRLAVVTDEVVTRREQAPRPARYEPPAVPAKTVPTWSTVPLRDVGKYVGEKLRVVTTDGNEFEGRLVGEDVNELRFERRIAAGTMAIHVVRSEVRSLHKVGKRRRS
jgi:uncharacterized integral membrane protein